MTDEEPRVWGYVGQVPVAVHEADRIAAIEAAVADGRRIGEECGYVLGEHAVRQTETVIVPHAIGPGVPGPVARDVAELTYRGDVDDLDPGPIQVRVEYTILGRKPMPDHVSPEPPSQRRVNVGPGGTLDLDNVFTYHPPHGDQIGRYETLRGAGKALAEQIADMCPPGPERSTAITKVREAIMWANASIACGEAGPAVPGD